MDDRGIIAALIAKLGHVPHGLVEFLLQFIFDDLPILVEGDGDVARRHAQSARPRLRQFLERHPLTVGDEVQVRARRGDERLDEGARVFFRRDHGQFDVAGELDCEVVHAVVALVESRSACILDAVFRFFGLRCLF